MAKIPVPRFFRGILHHVFFFFIGIQTTVPFPSHFLVQTQIASFAYCSKTLRVSYTSCQLAITGGWLVWFQIKRTAMFSWSPARWVPAPWVIYRSGSYQEVVTDMASQTVQTAFHVTSEGLPYLKTRFSVAWTHLRRKERPDSNIKILIKFLVEACFPSTL